MTPRKLSDLIDVHKKLNGQDYAETENKVKDNRIDWHGQKVTPIDLVAF